MPMRIGTTTTGDRLTFEWVCEKIKSIDWETIQSFWSKVMMSDQKYRVFQMLDSTKTVLIHGLSRQEALDYVIKMDHEQTQKIAYHLWQVDCSDCCESKSPEHYWFLAEHREDLRHYRYGIEPDSAISATQFKWAAKGSG